MKKLILLFMIVCMCIRGSAQIPYIQWQLPIGGSALDEGRHIIQNTDSTLVVIGTSASNDSDVSGNHGGYDYWVAKLTQSSGKNLTADHQWTEETAYAALLTEDIL